MSSRFFRASFSYRGPKSVNSSNWDYRSPKSPMSWLAVLRDNPHLKTLARQFLMRLRRGETVPARFPAQTPSLPPWVGVIICAVLAGSRLRLHSAFARATLRLPLYCGCADHHVLRLIAEADRCLNSH